MASRSVSSRSRSPLPFVFLNMSMTADGKIASANRAVTHFGSPADSRHLYALRATADAILCGARTVEESNTILGNGGEQYCRRRLSAGLAEYPVRVVVSGTGTLSPQAKIWTKRFSPIVVLTSRRAGRRLLTLRRLADHVWVCGSGAINFPAALARLRAEFGIERLLCEGGGAVNDALFRTELVDEINLTLCPFILGGRAAPTLADGLGVSRLADAAQFELKSRRRVGDELFFVYGRRNAG